MFSRHMVVAAQSQHILASCRNQGDAKTYEVRCFFDTQNPLRKKHLKDFEYSGNWKNMLMNFHHRFHMIPIKLPPQMCIQLSKSLYFTSIYAFLLPFTHSFIFYLLKFHQILVRWDGLSLPPNLRRMRSWIHLFGKHLTHQPREMRHPGKETGETCWWSFEYWVTWLIWKISLFLSSISLISFPLAVCIRRYIRTLGNSFSNGVLAAPCCRNPKKLEVRTPEVFLNWSKQVQHVSRFQNSSKIATGCINGISIIYILVVMIQMIQIIQNCSLPFHLASHFFRVSRLFAQCGYFAPSLFWCEGPLP